MKFKQFLKEMEGVPEVDPTTIDYLSELTKILAGMSSDEVNRFGHWLYDAAYEESDSAVQVDDDDMDEDYNDSEDYSEDEPFTKDEVQEMLISLSSDDLKYVYDMLMDETLWDYDDNYAETKNSTAASTGSGNDEVYEEYEKELQEKKFFQKRKAIVNREKKQNRVQRRKDKKARRIEYRKHKAIIKRKQKKYRRKTKRNPNLVRHHR